MNEETDKTCAILSRRPGKDGGLDPYRLRGFGAGGLVGFGSDTGGAAGASGALRKRDQNPRRWPGCCSAEPCEFSSGEGCGPEAGTVPVVATGAGVGVPFAPTVLDTASAFMNPWWTRQMSRGSVPRTKYSLYTIERRVGRPSGPRTIASLQPAAASLPLRRQTLALTTVRGARNQTGLSPAVAAFMNRPHIGTARSPAYPLSRIVRGVS